MIVLGIDPGKTSGLAVLDTETRRVLGCDEWATEQFDMQNPARFLPRAARVAVDVVTYELWVSYGRGFNASNRDPVGIGYWLEKTFAAVPVSRPEAIRALGISGGKVSKGAVWAETMRVLGGDDRGGKLCPRRGRKSHTVAGREGLASWSGSDPNCPACNGTGYERIPGSLSMFKGKGHAKDALSLAVAYAIKMGLL